MYVAAKKYCSGLVGGAAPRSGADPASVTREASPSDLLRGSRRPKRSRVKPGMTASLLSLARNQGRVSDRRASAGPAPWAGALAVGSAERRARMYIAAIKYCSGHAAAPSPGPALARLPSLSRRHPRICSERLRPWRSRVKPGMTASLLSQARLPFHERRHPRTCSEGLPGERDPRSSRG
jgi:hypothetical protein